MIDDTCDYQALWQSVILQAITDATAKKVTKSSSSGVTRFEQNQARSWMGGRDFYTTCSLAGWDGDFILEAYRDGRVSQAKLRAAVKPHRRNLPQEGRA